MTATKKLRSPLKWHGGKSYLARRIIALFPPHKVYVEPYLGGGSILLNKPRAEVEVAGDIDGRLIEFWGCLQGSSAMVELLGEVPYDETTFETGLMWMGSESPVRRAIGFLIRNRFSRGGLGRDFAWSDRLRGGQPGDVNAWDTIREELPAIAGRIEGVEFNCCRAASLIGIHDHEDALVYCDPPYLHETRTHKTAYAHEMDAASHEILLDTLLTSRAKVFLSGYRSALYDRYLASWTRHEFEIANHSGQGKTKQRRVECVWEKPS